MESLVKQKRKLWKEWQKGSSKEKNLEAERKPKSSVHLAKRKVQEERFTRLERSDSTNFIFKLAKRIKRENQDNVSDKYVENDEVCLT